MRYRTYRIMYSLRRARTPNFILQVIFSSPGQIENRPGLFTRCFSFVPLKSWSTRQVQDMYLRSGNIINSFFLSPSIPPNPRHISHITSSRMFQSQRYHYPHQPNLHRFLAGIGRQMTAGNATAAVPTSTRKPGNPLRFRGCSLSPTFRQMQVTRFI